MIPSFLDSIMNTAILDKIDSTPFQRNLQGHFERTLFLEVIYQMSEGVNLVTAANIMAVQIEGEIEMR